MTREELVSKLKSNLNVPTRTHALNWNLQAAEAYADAQVREFASEVRAKKTIAGRFPGDEVGGEAIVLEDLESTLATFLNKDNG